MKFFSCLGIFLLFLLFSGAGWDENNDAWITLENSALFAGIYRMRGDSGVISPQHFNEVLSNSVREITPKAVHFDAELSQWDFGKINKEGIDVLLAAPENIIGLN